MTTRIPVTIEGNLTADPEHDTSEKGVEYARLSVAVNDRRLNEQTGKWEDAGTVFHRAVVFNGSSQLRVWWAARRCLGRGRGLPRMGVLTLPTGKTSTCLTLHSPALT